MFEERGDLLGFMALVDDYLAALFVPPIGRDGVGHALLQEARSRCAELHTRVFVENEPAVRFYRRHGFEIGEVPDPHRPSSVPDALPSRLNLTSGAAPG